MARWRHTPEQIIRKLVEGNKLLAAGSELDEVCRHLEITESTWHRWIAHSGGMNANDAKRLKELEQENGRRRDKHLNGWHLDSLLEARVLIEDSRSDSNMNRPRSSLVMLTPDELARAWTERNQAAPT